MSIPLFNGQSDTLWPDDTIQLKNWPDQDVINNHIYMCIHETLKLTDLDIEYNELPGGIDTWTIRDPKAQISPCKIGNDLIAVVVDADLKLIVCPIAPHPTIDYVIGRLLLAFSEMGNLISSFPTDFPNSYLQYCIAYRTIGPDIITAQTRLSHEKKNCPYPGLIPVYGKLAS